MAVADQIDSCLEIRAAAANKRWAAPATALEEDTGGALRRTLARVYNNLGQLTSLKDAGYNANGNCTALTTAAGTVSYTYPVDSHRLPAVDGGARNHDSAGNTAGIGRREFVRNAANRMGAIKQGGAMMES